MNTRCVGGWSIIILGEKCSRFLCRNFIYQLKIHIINTTLKYHVALKWNINTFFIESTNQSLSKSLYSKVICSISNLFYAGFSWIYTTIFGMISIFVSFVRKSFSRRKKTDPILPKIDRMLFFWNCLILDDAKIWRCRQFLDPILEK